MAKFTREAIKATFLRLLEERPFSEITVKNIVEIIREESDAVIEKYSSVNSIVECFDAIEDFASHRKRAIMHIYRSVSRDVFERYLMKTSEYFISQYIDALAAEGEIDQSLISRNKSLIVGYYKCLFFGVIIEWLESGMDEQLAKDFRRIFRLKADTADELADILGLHLFRHILPKSSLIHKVLPAVLASSGEKSDGAIRTRGDSEQALRYQSFRYSSIPY